MAPMKRPPVGSTDEVRVVGPVYDNTPEERRKAALYVAGMVGDVDTARELLDALGLLGGGDGA